MFKSIAVAAAALLLSVPAKGFGQVNPDSIKHRNDCRLAVQILTDGHPANKLEWAVKLAPSCGSDGGAGIGAIIRRQASVSDPDAIEHILWPAFHLRDRSVFEAALGVAGSSQATVAARVQAIRVLSAQLNPLFGTSPLSYGFFAHSLSNVGSVSLGAAPVASDEVALAGDPLPADAFEEAETVMEHVRSEVSGAPDEVQNAATLLLAQIAGYRKCNGLSSADCVQQLTRPDSTR